MSKSIKRLAIANRGEVALRIVKACQELGIESVLLCSEPDKGTEAYRQADLAVCIGPAPSKESYLNIENNIQGALSTGVDAIHPGFGFLSENADFARKCKENGILFVGPSAEAIDSMGDKISARNLMKETGVPLVPGAEFSDFDALEREVMKMGLPVIIKAALGGGGRGLKIVRDKSELKNQYEAAQREALSGFGSDKVFVEKYFDSAKHIEIQIFGDSHGNYVHLGERECSIQRRHQKIVEEAPSGSLNLKQREEATQKAIDAAKKIDYVGAGTVEFLFDGSKFYFLEMNTRLQVEHPVTEMVYGVDLVKAQISVAEGQVLPWTQDDIQPKGHSIECRIYAEDPFKGGIPSTGEILGLNFPQGPGRRFDFGWSVGDEVTSYYDSMIGKIIVWDENRERAILKLNRVLKDSVIFGVRTNIPYLLEIINHDEFKSSKMTTKFIESHFSKPLNEAQLSGSEKKFLDEVMPQLRSNAATSSSKVFSNPWDNKWSNV